MKKSKKNIIKVMLVASLIVSLFTGCQSSNKVNKSQEITIFAASSLTESMEEIVKNYKKENPNIKVNLHLASSSNLRVQIEQGVKADIFISANEKHYDKLKDEDFILKGNEFLYNSMVLIVPKDNPAKIENLKDISNNCKFVTAQKEVPAGNYARQIIHSLDKDFGQNYESKVLNNIVSEENNIKQVVNKVLLGEADGAFVYKSDVTENVKDKVHIINIPDKNNVIASYWIGQLKQSEDVDEVEKMYSFILSSNSKNVFKKYGFDIDK